MSDLEIKAQHKHMQGNGCSEVRVPVLVDAVARMPAHDIKIELFEASIYEGTTPEELKAMIRTLCHAIVAERKQRHHDNCELQADWLRRMKTEIDDLKAKLTERETK